MQTSGTPSDRSTPPKPPETITNQREVRSLTTGDQERGPFPPYSGGTPAGVDALLDACDADLDAPAPDEAWYAEMRLIALRDAAMIDVLYSTGLRQAELARLALDDYDPARRSLRVRGKSDKERLVLVTRSAAARVEAWLAERGRDTGGLVAPFTPRSQRIRAASAAASITTPARLSAT
ncbi:tyrosine-type recombinase/integrase [Nonomuraea sp. NPDC048882]|uniref:tyrosine-type recombinase/integrase n=1 Tax=Nonomuraea sp. NPDC048882 TaxID=3154347 RepID=UPI0033DC7504